MLKYFGFICISLIITANTADAATQGTLGSSSKGSMSIRLEIPHQITKQVTEPIKTITNNCANPQGQQQETKILVVSQNSPNMLSLNCAQADRYFKNANLVFELTL